MTKPLTRAQLRGLADIGAAGAIGASPWLFGATTIHVLRERALIARAPAHGNVVITAAGQAARDAARRNLCTCGLAGLCPACGAETCACGLARACGTCGLVSP